MKLPKPMLRKLLLIRIAKGDGEQVAEVLSWGADPNTVTKLGTPAIVKAVRHSVVDVRVVEALVKAGADANATDPEGLTALDRARRRLSRFDGKPRTPPRRSPSLTPGGELRLRPEEWDFIEKLRATSPHRADEIEEEYLVQRRKAADRIFDTPGNLEKIVSLLEPLSPPKA